MEFEWNNDKARKNLKKHSISFYSACSVFYDDSAIELYDHENSDLEDRYISIGKSETGAVLAVSYTIRDDTCRIISARKLSKNEVKKYGY